MQHPWLTITQALLVLLVSAPLSGQMILVGRARVQSEGRPLYGIYFLDVPDIPARIDGLKLERDGKKISMTCSVANSSDEGLLGLRLMLLDFDEMGKLRNRITWSERVVLGPHSISKASFKPPGLRIQAGDNFMLGIEEVIGRETIWRATGLEKALKAYLRGARDVLPEVRTTANKFDTRPEIETIRIRN